MSEMIERVARALAFKHDQEHNTKGATIAYNAGSIAKNYWDCLAKAAIAAMREPTSQQMTEYSEMKIKTGEKKAFNVSEWEMMIDAALAEDTSDPRMRMSHKDLPKNEPQWPDGVKRDLTTFEGLIKK